jgi:hypothetical protein
MPGGIRETRIRSEFDGAGRRAVGRVLAAVTPGFAKKVRGAPNEPDRIAARAGSTREIVVNFERHSVAPVVQMMTRLEVHRAI